MKFEIDVKKVNQTMKLLDVMNYIFVDYIKKIDYKDVLDYHRARYMFKEIIDEFEEINNLLKRKQTLMATVLLRNAYEEVLYIIAVSEDPSKEANVNTKAGYFKDYVKEHSATIFVDTITGEDIQDTYKYLSKLVHVTNLKELASYLVSDKPCADIIAREMQVSLVVVEFMYLYYLYESLNMDYSLPKKLFLLVPLIDIVNLIRLINESDGKREILEDYIRNDTNREYLRKETDKVLPELQSLFDDYKDNINGTISDVDILIEKQNYKDEMNKILSEEV